VSFLGCEGDEHAYKDHGGPDRALMQYGSPNYALWQSEIPENAHLFIIGGFGENLVSEIATEENVCVGDILKIGKEVLVQVSEPREPCFKLGYRFEVQDMALRCQNLYRTGWYLRVFQEGYLQAGDEIVLVERKYPKWTIKNVLHYMYQDTQDRKVIEELSALPELGRRIRGIFTKRLKKINQGALSWSPYRLIRKYQETPLIYSFLFEAVTPIKSAQKIKPGSHIRVKLGKDEKLIRPYSIISGTTNRFLLGIALDSNTRGGSRYFHESVQVDSILSFSEIKTDFPLSPDAENHIFIAGGIGITTFLAATEDLQSRKVPYHLYYAVRMTSSIAFREQLQRLAPNVTILDGSKNQRLDISDILQWAKSTPKTHIYTCGPTRLMTVLTSIASTLSFPPENLHFEAFTTLAAGLPFSVELAKSKKKLEVKADQSLLEVLREVGMDVPSSCEAGNCGTCKVKVKCGEVEHKGWALLDSERKEGDMLSCVSRGVGTIVLDL